MSKLSESTYDLLKEIFPHNIILKEYYVKYKGTRLFFDFFVKDMLIFVEVQGRQHDEFIKHFHEDRAGFLEHKRRDNLKKEYCEKRESVLLEIRSEEELDKDKIIERIWSAMIT
jgi:hypothetical protein